MDSQNICPELKETLKLIRALFVDREVEYGFSNTKSKTAQRLHNNIIYINSWLLNLASDNPTIAIQGFILIEVMKNRLVFKKSFIKRRTETREHVNEYIKKLNMYFQRILRISRNFLKINQQQQ